MDAETSEAGQESTCSSGPADAKIGDIGEEVRQGRMCEREQNKEEREEKQEKFGGGRREKIRGQPVTDCLYRSMTPAGGRAAALIQLLPSLASNFMGCCEYRRPCSRGWG